MQLQERCLHHVDKVGELKLNGPINSIESSKSSHPPTPRKPRAFDHTSTWAVGILTIVWVGGSGELSRRKNLRLVLLGKRFY